jgi:uncharacterized protein
MNRRWLMLGAMAFLVITGFSATFLAPPAPGDSAAGDPPVPTGPLVPSSPFPVATNEDLKALSDAPLRVEPAPVASPSAAEVVPAALAEAPALQEKMQNAALPVPIAKSGLPRIAILVADLGGNPALARAAIAQLPSEMGLGFSPYGSDLAALSSAARKQGHEIWVGVPMQPKRYPAIDPGKNSLLLSQPATENVRRFNWALAQIPGSKTGFYNMMGSAFTAKSTAMVPVLEAAAQQDIAFVDARSGLDTVGMNAARTALARAALSRGFIDEPQAGFARRLDQLVATARKDGEAVAMVSASPQTVAALSAWAATAKATGFELVTPGQLSR